LPSPKHAITSRPANFEGRRDRGKNKAESIRILKRRLSDVVYQALLRDARERDRRTRRGLIDIGASGRN
jgi:hypothetical protein